MAHDNRLLRALLTTAVLLLTAVGAGCSQDWPSFRHNNLRTAAQLEDTALSDPAQVPNLAIRWTFTPPGAPNNRFRASPIVFNGRVYVGNQNGHFYALNSDTGAVVWQYPAAASPGFSSQFQCNASSQGLASSATIARINGTDAVIFGGPDQSFGTGLGEGRLFALNAATGAEIWKSPVVARLTGLTGGSTSEFHQQIGYSSPLVFGDHVYVGVGDHCDNPIQKGRVVSVKLGDGTIEGAFSYCSTGTCADSARGGGVWSSVAGFGQSLYVTTGNTKQMGVPEPSPNNGLSLLSLNKDTGAINWKFQPVPFALDGDPDWAASPTYMLASCGEIVISTMKDGWTHALTASTGARRWTFPPATIPFTSGVHGDSRYMRSGAAWDDVYIAMNGGLNLASSVSSGYRRLHAFNVCANGNDRLRWLLDVPGTSGAVYSLGSPTVTSGVVYIGTDLGHLVAIADPSIFPADGFRCSNPAVANANCVSMGFTFVPQPHVLKDIQLDGRMVYTEPAIARGRIYAATENGNLYMLSP